MARFLDACAADAGVAVQRGLFYGGNSDAAAMHLVGSGVPVGILNLARRYSHSPAEMLDLNDAMGAFRMLVAAVTSFSAATDLSFLGDGVSGNRIENDGTTCRHSERSVLGNAATRRLGVTDGLGCDSFRNLRWYPRPSRRTIRGLLVGGRKTACLWSRYARRCSQASLSP
jgi:hypothetical protein